MMLFLRNASPYSFMAESFPHQRRVYDSPHFAVSTSHILSGVVRARNKMQRGASSVVETERSVNVRWTRLGQG